MVLARRFSGESLATASERGERSVEAASDTSIWYQSGMPAVALRWVLIRDPQGTFARQALLRTDLDATPEQVLAWFVRRWRLGVTWEEARRHLGVETQRQWPGLAIRRAAWYPRTLPTFADALALVRRKLWAAEGFALSARGPDIVRLPRAFVDNLTETLAYAA